MRALVLLIPLLLCADQTVSAPKAMRYKSADIYLYGWDLRTRTRLSLEDVRHMSDITTTIRSPDSATAFAASLRLDALLPLTTPVVNEPRLVIDLVRLDGTRETFYANDFHLFSEDGKRLRKIDACFQRRFELLPAGGCR